MKKSLFLLLAGTLALSACGTSDTDDLGTPLPSRASSAAPVVQTQVELTSPEPNAIVKSPLKVKGKAHGNWFFEGSLPLQLVDVNGTVISEGFATADSDWMTTDWVDFKGELVFKTSADKGTLIIKKDNPSDLPENDASMQFPVRFR